MEMHNLLVLWLLNRPLQCTLHIHIQSNFVCTKLNLFSLECFMFLFGKHQLDELLIKYWQFNLHRSDSVVFMGRWINLCAHNFTLNDIFQPTSQQTYALCIDGVLELNGSSTNQQKQQQRSQNKEKLMMNAISEYLYQSRYGKIQCELRLLRIVWCVSPCFSLCKSWFPPFQLKIAFCKLFSISRMIWMDYAQTHGSIII